MSEKRETLADIVAEMRYGAIPKHRTDHELLALYVDRLEAAHKREVDRLNSVIQAQRSAFDAEQDRQRRAAPGDAAAMREALVGLIDGICFHCDLSEDCKGVPCEKMQKAKAALAAPARNCDRFKTKEEAAIAFANEKKQWIPQQVLWELAPWLDWLFATATKGETYGNNMAATREALSDIIDKINRWRADGSMEHWQYSQLFDIANWAIAEPPRNCDEGTAEKQKERFLKFCVRQDCEKGCPFRDCRSTYECAFTWAQMPYESEAGK